MEYFLVTLKSESGQHVFNYICSIDTRELSAYRVAVGELKKWVSPEQFILLKYSHDQYVETINSLRQQYRGTPVPNPASTNLTINFALLSFLSMSRLYLDHIKNMLTKLDSTKEVEIGSFEAARIEEYENHFAYRFGYKLRDYAQHCGFPIGEFDASKEIIKDEQMIQYKFTPYFSRDELLSSFDNWKSKVKGDLKMQPKLFSVDNIVYEIMECFERINSKVIRAARPRLLEQVKVIQNLVNRAQGQSNLHILKIKNKNEQKENVSINLERVPIEYLDLLTISI